MQKGVVWQIKGGRDGNYVIKWTTSEMDKKGDLGRDWNYLEFCT